MEFNTGFMAIVTANWWVLLSSFDVFMVNLRIPQRGRSCFLREANSDEELDEKIYRLGDFKRIMNVAKRAFQVDLWCVQSRLTCPFLKVQNALAYYFHPLRSILTSTR